MTEATVNPAALTPDQMAQLLAAAGGRAITEDAIREDIAAGAPANADGTINIVHYAAWLVKQAGDGRPETGGRE